MHRQMGVCEEQGLWERDSVLAKKTLWLQKALHEHVKEWKGLSAYLSPCRLILCPEWPDQSTVTAEKAEALVSRAPQLCPGLTHCVVSCCPLLWQDPGRGAVGVAITASIGNRGWEREASEGKGLALKCRWLSSGPHTSARWATQVDAFTPGMRQKGSVPPSEACP